MKMSNVSTLPAETIMLLDVLKSRFNAHPSWHDLERKLTSDKEVLDFALAYALRSVRAVEESYKTIGCQV